MGEHSAELLETVRKIYGLLELLAEDKIAQRDAKQRTVLCGIVAAGNLKQRAVLLMDGTRTRKDIIDATSIDQSNLSKLIDKLSEAKLLVGDKKSPKLAIPIPQDFFETNAKTK
jgi:hypothetical protein